MTDLISELCQLTAEILQDNPQADLARLVALVKTNIDANSQLTEAIQDDRRLVQINKGDAKGFQTLVALQFQYWPQRQLLKNFVSY